MGYKSYTLEEVKEVKSCTGLLKDFVEQYVSPRERVRIMLNPLRDLISEGLKRRTPRAKLLSLVNASDEVRQSEKISAFQFRRYLSDEFPHLLGARIASRPSKNETGGVHEAEAFRLGVNKTMEERRHRV